MFCISSSVSSVSYYRDPDPSKNSPSGVSRSPGWSHVFFCAVCSLPFPPFSAPGLSAWHHVHLAPSHLPGTTGISTGPYWTLFSLLLAAEDSIIAPCIFSLSLIYVWVSESMRACTYNFPLFIYSPDYWMSSLDCVYITEGINIVQRWRGCPMKLGDATSFVLMRWILWGSWNRIDH